MEGNKEKKKEKKEKKKKNINIKNILKNVNISTNRAIYDG